MAARHRGQKARVVNIYWPGSGGFNVCGRGGYIMKPIQLDSEISAFASCVLCPTHQSGVALSALAAKSASRVALSTKCRR